MLRANYPEALREKSKPPSSREGTLRFRCLLPGRHAKGNFVMKRIVALSGLGALVAASLALAPAPSHSASKGRAASPPPGKSIVAPPNRAPVRQPGRGVTAKPGGKGTSATPGGKGKGTARRIGCRQRCESALNRCLGDFTKPLSWCFRTHSHCISACGGPAPLPSLQAR